MAKQIILLPHVLEKIKAEYAPLLQKDKEEFKDFLQRMLNPNNRGIITSQVGEQKDQLKVWGEEFSLICVEASEEESIKAVNIRPTKAFQYQFILETGYVVEGPWEFASVKEVRKMNSYGNDRELAADIELIQQTVLKEQEYAEFEEYWNQLDVVNTYMAQSMKDQRDKSVTEFKDIKIDFDRNSFVIKLDQTSWNFSSGERIRICTKESWDKSMNANNKDISRVYSIGIGSVSKYRGNGQLMVESYSTDLLKKLHKDKEFGKGSGYIWVDDAGNRSIITRQKEALQTLFNKESANPDLKEFIPDANLLMPLASIEEWDGNNANLTSAQKQAVKGALSGQNLYMIQGPPGTGKTTVISEIIKALTKENKKVLLSSQTHLAVDNVLQRIGEEDGVRAIRIGNEEKIELACEKYSLTNRVISFQEETSINLRDLKQEMQQMSKDLSRMKVLYEAHVKMKGEIRYITNLLKQLSEKERDVAAILQNIEVQENLVSNLELKAKDFLVGTDISSLEIIFTEIHKNGSSIQDASEGAYLSLNLKIAEDDEDSIELYDDMVQEWKRMEDEVGCISGDLEKLLQLRRKYEEDLRLKTERYNELIVSGDRGSYEELSDIGQKVECLRIELNETFFRANGLVKERATIQHSMESLYNEAIKNQSVIEYYINTNNSLWDKLLNRPHLKKAEFLDFVQSKKEFEQKFDFTQAQLQNFHKLEGYERYRANQEEMQLAEANLISFRKEESTSKKKLLKFQSALEAYKTDPLISLYSNHYSSSVKSFEEAQENQRIEAFIGQYEEKEHKLALLEKTTSIRQDWENHLNYYQESFEDIYIQMSNLIGATCVGISSTQNNHFLSTEFDYVIIDEAARSSSLELLIPMVRGKNIILVGDHKQISPQVDKDIMKRIENDYDFSEETMNSLFNESLFGLMYDRIDSKLKTFLNEQFRMHTDISQVVSKYFYENKLMDGYNILNKRHSLEDLLPSSLYWINTPNEELYLERKPKHGTSYWNKGELEITKNLLLWLDNQLSSNKEVGIIAPYKEQKHRLAEELEGLAFVNLSIEVNTVDAFQGREKNYIIMNVVRNNKNRSIGHTANYARINVALSRAQELMFIVGNDSFISANKDRAFKLNQVLQHIRNKDRLLNEQFFYPEVSKS